MGILYLETGYVVEDDENFYMRHLECGNGNGRNLGLLFGIKI